MTEKESKFLYDISNSIYLIQEFISDTPSFTAYQNDLKTKSAVERHLAIIGEAVNKFRKISEDHTLEHAAQIISLRNRLIHSYDSIDDSIVWAIVSHYLLPLQREVQKLQERDQ
ncbi:DUF86 domain-containing protein [Flavimarina sp. Hel_I_48]|uniref:HepT-like ribonuclease domain-containing protein n=1 Tax=Flavimarina sp. Hel_I_48 TaxID=1392488 RepID=UPI0004DFA847|nr:HepT-like ribonuclease domain-containing protein [Flavimarina sp. Hel_I_48]